jgi:hypothetical protein
VFYRVAPQFPALVEALLPDNILEAERTLEEAVDIWSNFGANELPSQKVRGIQEEWEKPLNELALNALRLNQANHIKYQPGETVGGNKPGSRCLAICASFTPNWNPFNK